MKLPKFRDLGTVGIAIANKDETRNDELSCAVDTRDCHVADNILP